MGMHLLTSHRQEIPHVRRKEKQASGFSFHFRKGRRATEVKSACVRVCAAVSVSRVSSRLHLLSRFVCRWN